MIVDRDLKPRQLNFRRQSIAGTDFNGAEGTLTFAPGETTKTITVSILADSLQEITETFQLNLSNALHASIFAKGIGTILDNN